jgi:hypothetical protein
VVSIDLIKLSRYFLEQLNKGSDGEFVTDLILEDDLAFIGSCVVADGAGVW